MDLVAEDVDMAVGGSVKFLLGGPGVGYLYVRPELVETMVPRLTGWMAHERPFAFEVGEHRLRREGTWRFLGGTPHVPALYAARVGYGIVREIGIPAIRERSLRLTGRLIATARERGWRVVTPLETSRRGGSVTLGLPEADALVKQLALRDILVDARPRAGLRVGPHFYTTEAEIDRFVDATAAAMLH
jgi:kynureninase